MFLQLYCTVATFVADRKAAFVNDRRGVSAMEYALMGALIAVVIVTAVTTIGTNMKNTFTNIANAVK